MDQQGVLTQTRLEYIDNGFLTRVLFLSSQQTATFTKIVAQGTTAAVDYT